MSSFDKLSGREHTPFRFLEELDQKEQKKSAYGHVGISTHLNLGWARRLISWLKGDSISLQLGKGNFNLTLGTKSAREFVLRHADKAGLTDSQISVIKHGKGYSLIADGIKNILDNPDVRTLMQNSMALQPNEVKATIYSALTDPTQKNLIGSYFGRMSFKVQEILGKPKSAVAEGHAPAASAPFAAQAQPPQPSPQRPQATDDELVAQFQGFYNNEITDEKVAEFLKNAGIKKLLEIDHPQTCTITILRKIESQFEHSNPVKPRLTALISDLTAKKQAADKAEEANAQKEEEFNRTTHSLDADALWRMIASDTKPDISKENVSITATEVLTHLMIKKIAPKEFKSTLIRFIGSKNIGEGMGQAPNIEQFRMTIPKDKFLTLLQELRAARKGAAEVKPAPAASLPVQAEKKPLGLNPAQDRKIVFDNLVTEKGKAYADGTKKGLYRALGEVLSDKAPTAEQLEKVHPQWHKLIVYSFKDKSMVITGELLKKLDVVSLCQLYARSCWNQTKDSNGPIYQALRDKLESTELPTSQKTEIQTYLETFENNNQEQLSALTKLLSGSR